MPQSSTLGDTIELRFEPQLDTATCQQIEEEVRAAVTNPPGSVVFNLEGVEFVSSSFLRLCVYASRQAKGGDFHVISVDPNIRRVFKIAGFDAMLEGD
jgi:anti-anti-sigma factor